MLDTQKRKLIRNSGLLYFLLAVTAPFGLMYVPEQIFVRGDIAATAANIRNMEGMLRLGIASELFHQAVAIFLVVALYKMFKPVNEGQAKLLVILGALVSVPIMYLNVLNWVAALMLAGDGIPLASISRDQADTLAYLFMRLHGHGVIIASTFWGLWLFPFGILIIQSGFIPKILGYGMFIAGIAYTAYSFIAFVTPDLLPKVETAAMVMEFCEVPTLLWMFGRGLVPLRKVPA